MTITISPGVSISTGVTISAGAAPGNYFLSYSSLGFEWTQSTGTLRFYGTDGTNLIANAVNAGNIVVGQTVTIDNGTIFPPIPPFRYFGIVSSWDISNVGPAGNVYLYLSSPGSQASQMWAAYSGIQFTV